MDILMKIITVMTVGAIFFWGGFPAALAFKFPVFMAGFITAAGAEAAVIIVLLLGRPLQNFVLRKFPAWEEKTRNGKVGTIWQKYGMPGLGLIAPVFPGAPQATLIALVLSARPVRIFIWVSLGIALWSAFVTTGLSLGLELL